jgi:hypothetical protein
MKLNTITSRVHTEGQAINKKEKLNRKETVNSYTFQNSGPNIHRVRTFTDRFVIKFAFVYNLAHKHEGLRGNRRKFPRILDLGIKQRSPVSRLGSSLSLIKEPLVPIG